MGLKMGVVWSQTKKSCQIICLVPIFTTMGGGGTTLDHLIWSSKSRWSFKHLARHICKTTQCVTHHNHISCKPFFEVLTFQYLITLIKRLPICNNYFQMFLSWGNARSELVKGEDRTLENISQPHQDWVMNTGGDRKKSCWNTIMWNFYPYWHHTPVKHHCYSNYHHHHCTVLDWDLSTI